MSVHVPIFVQSKSDRGVYMRCTSPVEVLFVYLPNYDSPCIRAEWTAACTKEPKGIKKQHQWNEMQKENKELTCT